VHEWRDRRRRGVLGVLHGDASMQVAFLQATRRLTALE
jgi:hypothetical protein